MDLLTQGLLGGVLALTAARRHEYRLAAVVGFFSGLLADADVFIRSSHDPLLSLEFHRHFTHSLVFIPLGALLAALLLWPLLHRRLGFQRLYLFALLGFCLSGFLDACTSYGTHWLWPFTDEPLAFSIIAIVDPVFTLGLMFALLFALRQQNRLPVVMGLVFCASYLLLGLWQSQRIEAAAERLAEQRGHWVEAMMVKPTLGNLVLWRSIYIADQRIYVDAIRAGVGEVLHYPGDSAGLFDQRKDLPPMSAATVHYQDIERFVRWSDGFVFFDEERQLLGDARYSLLPNSLAPLWGLQLSPAHPEQHARYVVFRSMGREQRQQFLNMLMGRALQNMGG